MLEEYENVSVFVPTFQGSILTLLESVSEDFDWKNGIRGSELTLFSSGWGLRDEGLDLTDALKGSNDLDFQRRF